MESLMAKTGDIAKEALSLNFLDEISTNFSA
jgi:hypothetical protein